MSCSSELSGYFEHFKMRIRCLILEFVEITH